MIWTNALISLVISCNSNATAVKNPTVGRLQTNRQHAHRRELIIHHEEAINPFLDQLDEEETRKHNGDGLIIDKAGNTRTAKGGKSKVKVSKGKTTKEKKKKSLKCKKLGKDAIEDAVCKHDVLHKSLKHNFSESFSSPVLEPASTPASSPILAPAASPSSLLSLPSELESLTTPSAPAFSPIIIDSPQIESLPTLHSKEPITASEFLTRLSSGSKSKSIYQKRVPSSNISFEHINGVENEDRDNDDQKIESAHIMNLPSKVVTKENEDGIVEHITIYFLEIITEKSTLELRGEGLQLADVQKILFPQLVRHIQDYFSQKIGSVFDYYYPSLHFNSAGESDLVGSEATKKSREPTTYFVQISMTLHVESSDATIIENFYDANTTQTLLISFFNDQNLQDLLNDASDSGLDLEKVHLLKPENHDDSVAEITEDLLPSKVVLKENEDGTIDGSMIYFHDVSTEPIILQAGAENPKATGLEKTLFEQLEDHIAQYYYEVLGSIFMHYHLDVHFLEESAVPSSEGLAQNQDASVVFVEIISTLHLESEDPAMICDFDSANITQVLVNFFDGQALQQLLNDIKAAGFDLEYVNLITFQDGASGESSVYHQITPTTEHGGSSSILISAVAVSTLVFVLGAATYSRRNQQDESNSSSENQNRNQEEEADSMVQQNSSRPKNNTVRFSRYKSKNPYGVDDHDSLDSDVDSFLDWSKPIDSRRAWRRNKEMYEYGEVSSLVGVDLS